MSLSLYHGGDQAGTHVEKQRGRGGPEVVCSDTAQVLVGNAESRTGIIEDRTYGMFNNHIFYSSRSLTELPPFFLWSFKFPRNSTAQDSSGDAFENASM